MQSMFKYPVISNITLISQWKNKVNAKGNWWPNLTSPFLNNIKPHVAFTWCQGEGRLFATERVPLLHPDEGSAGAASQTKDQGLIPLCPVSQSITQCKCDLKAVSLHFPSEGWIGLHV